MKEQLKQWFSISKNIVIVFLLGYVLFLKECKKCDNYVISSNHTDTVFLTKDTIIYKDSISYVYVNKKPKPIDSTTLIKIYNDSLINDSLKLKIYTNSLVSGVLLTNSIKFDFVPSIHEVITTKIITKTVTNSVIINKSGFYGSANIGNGIGLNIDYITKKDNLYGLTYNRFDGKDFYAIKIGAKIKIK